ncbi:hypothetical protein J2S78_000362 [Salibacterium salarium]|nr:hypothetical protein [Salibacterium salarium]
MIDEAVPFLIKELLFLDMNLASKVVVLDSKSSISASNDANLASKSLFG